MTDSIAGDLMIGAGPIAEFLYGENNHPNRHKVYRQRKLPIFRIGDQVAARKSALKAEIERLETATREVA
jgi:hypothetical protein